MDKPSIGVAMIMLNEASHVAAVVPQFYHIVDDIVIVDGGSSDGSVEWAKRVGARLFHRSFPNHFADQKNFAVEQLSTDWVYVHDLDERLEPPLISLIPKLVTREGQEALAVEGILPQSPLVFDCYGIARKNFVDGVQTSVYPDYQYRLFANYCRYRGRVYEEITNFRNRTEVDYMRTGQLANPEQNIRDAVSRYNILHYRSSLVEQERGIFFAKLKKQMEEEEEFAKK